MKTRNYSCWALCAVKRLGRHKSVRGDTATTSRGFAALVGAALAFMTCAQPASGAGVIVNDAAPNWLAFGIPQFPAIGACSDIVGVNCPNGFGGPASDLLSIRNPGGPVVWGYLTDAGEALANPVYWVDIRIPNAQWLSQAQGVWVDSIPEDTLGGKLYFSDYIGFINSPFVVNGVFGRANLLLISNNSDGPPSYGDFPANSFFDVFVELSLDNNAQTFMQSGPFTDLSGNVDPTTGNVNVNGLEPQFAEAPEPSSLVLIGSALLAMAMVSRKRAMSRSRAQ